MKRPRKLRFKRGEEVRICKETDFVGPKWKDNPSIDDLITNTKLINGGYDYWIRGRAFRDTELEPVTESSASEKDTNPKDAIGIKKVPLWFIPTLPLCEVGLAFMEGGRKYGAFNWRVSGVRASVYYDAIMRHMNAWKEGQDIDPDSGIHHISKAIACLMVIRDSIEMGNWEDDRPVKYPDGLSISILNEKAAGIIERYPDCKKPFTQNNTSIDRTKPVPGGY